MYNKALRTRNIPFPPYATTNKALKSNHEQSHALINKSSKSSISLPGSGSQLRAHKGGSSHLWGPTTSIVLLSLSLSLFLPSMSLLLYQFRHFGILIISHRQPFIMYSLFIRIERRAIYTTFISILERLANMVNSANPLGGC